MTRNEFNDMSANDPHGAILALFDLLEKHVAKIEALEATVEQLVHASVEA